MTGTALAEIDPDRWTMLQRMARTFYESKLIPEHFRKGVDEREGIANCSVAMLLAHQMGENPLMVLQNVYFVGGRAGWITQYVIARAKQSGVFRGPLRWRTEGEWPNLKVTCSAELKDAPDADCRVEISLDMQTARESGWTEYEEREGYGRDSRKTGKKLIHARWATPGMAEQMLRWRTAAWLVRLYAPECMFGLPTADELEDTTGDIKDITPPPAPKLDDFKPGASVAPPHEEEPADAPEKVAADTQAKRIRDQIARAKHIEWLNANALFGPSAAEDERLIKAQAGGEAVWADLVKRDAKRRLELAEGADA